MEAAIHILFSSTHFEISDFKCQCLECTKSKQEYQDTFSICFIRKGNFYFNVFRNSLDAYNGYILINKPGYDYTVTHVSSVPDECSIFTFKTSFYERLKEEFNIHTPWFLSNESIQSFLLKATPELECTHLAVLQKIKQGISSKLEMESMVIEILQQVLHRMAGHSFKDTMPASLKKNHLVTIELAKEYINENFTADISLFELADYCHVSPFHFSRIFKTFTGHSPNQYLQAMRLKQAELILKSTTLPITDVAFSSGFNSIDYFSAAFKNKYKLSPSLYRSKQQA